MLQSHCNSGLPNVSQCFLLSCVFHVPLCISLSVCCCPCWRGCSLLPHSPGSHLHSPYSPARNQQSAHLPLISSHQYIYPGSPTTHHQIVVSAFVVVLHPGLIENLLFLLLVSFTDLCFLAHQDHYSSTRCTANSPSPQPASRQSPSYHCHYSLWIPGSSCFPGPFIIIHCDKINSLSLSPKPCRLFESPHREPNRTIWPPWTQRTRTPPPTCQTISANVLTSQ